MWRIEALLLMLAIVSIGLMQLSASAASAGLTAMLSVGFVSLFLIALVLVSRGSRSPS